MYYVYVLKSLNYQKSYVGKTDNIERRLNEHNSGKGTFTNKYKPWKLIHAELFDSEREAIKKERYYKTHTGRKKLKEIFRLKCGIV